MRKNFAAQEHEDSWTNEEYSGLIIAMHEKKYEFLAELANPDATSEDVWNKAAQVCNCVIVLADQATKRKLTV